MNDTHNGFLYNVFREKPDLVVICGRRLGASVYEECQKWHDVVGGYRQFQVRWIILPGSSEPINVISAPLFGAEMLQNLNEIYPDGHAILHYWDGIFRDKLGSIAGDLTQAAHRNRL